MPTSKSRSTLGNAVKGALSRGQDPTTDPVVVRARQQLASDKLADFITRTVAQAPPLSQQQLDQLSLLLRQAGSGGREGAAS